MHKSYELNLSLKYSSSSFINNGARFKEENTVLQFPTRKRGKVFFCWFEDTLTSGMKGNDKNDSLAVLHVYQEITNPKTNISTVTQSHSLQ